MPEERPLALVTGVGRGVGIAAGIVERLATAEHNVTGWDIAAVYSSAYDDRVNAGYGLGGRDEVEERLNGLGARTLFVDADLADPGSPAQIFDTVTDALGPVTALVLSHAESVDSGLLDTTVKSFDRHFEVNARASWLLIREFARRFVSQTGTGRIVALTSDHTVGNLPYGASKGALDRIVIAAARELAAQHITSNVVNPGPIDTGWMDDATRAFALAATPLGRAGRPSDTAALVDFLLSPSGGWINGQLLFSDGGFSSKA